MNKLHDIEKISFDKNRLFMTVGGLIGVELRRTKTTESVSA